MFVLFCFQGQHFITLYSKRSNEQTFLKQNSVKIERKSQKQINKLWKTGLIFDQNNALLQTVLSVKQFFEQTYYNFSIFITFCTCNFFLFPKLKSMLKRTNFGSGDTIKKKVSPVYGICAPLLVRYSFYYVGQRIKGFLYQG